MRKELLFVIVVWLLVIFIPFPSSAQNNDENTAFIPNMLYESIQLLNNSDLFEPVTCGIEGSSGEFSFCHTQDMGYITLNWTHIAGTELEYNLTSSTLPMDFDFSYFGVEFSWNQNVLPTFANLSLSYNITTTGNFQYDNWPGMYEIWTWLESPNGNWYRFGTYYGGNDEPFFQWGMVADWATDLVFQDLIDLGSSSSAKVIIGLVPSWRFISGTTSDPWQTYNGSVLISFSNVNMDILYRTANDFPEEYQPLYESEWQQGDSDLYRDSYLLPDGRSLLLSAYEIDHYIQGSSLTMMDARAEIMWRKTWNGSDQIFWHDVGVFGNTIYLVGSITSPTRDNADLQLRALDLQGDFLWSKDYDLDLSGASRDLVISRDGQIYIGISGTEGNYRNYILKLDNNGLILWEREFSQRIWDNILSFHIDSEGNLFTLTFFELSKWSESGELLWTINEFFEDICTLNDGSVLTVRDYRTEALNLSKVDRDGNLQWSQILWIKYSEGWYDYLSPIAMKQIYDGQIYLLLGTGGYHPSRIIMRIDANGNHLGNTTIMFCDELYTSYNKPQYLDMHISDTNLIYVFGRILDRNWDYSLTVAIFGIEPLIIGSSSQDVLTTIGAVVVMVGTIVSLHKWRKRYPGK
ncbi:MAG: hypothetical protein ACFFF4_07535 [Candidatus Thorarchaeota archaeon]